MRNIKTCWLAIALVTACNSCTPSKFLCIQEFPNYEQKFEFDFSKDKLKERIIDAYPYDISVFRCCLAQPLLMKNC